MSPGPLVNLAGFSVPSTPLRLQADPGPCGRGVTIAFLDSGFHPHPDLGSRLVAFHDVGGEATELRAEACRNSWNWHGMQTSVVAAGDGVVAFAGVVAGTPTVSVDHTNGLRTTYQPVHARVARGEEVREGQMLGILGHPVDGWPGLHWGARRGPDDYVNPLGLLDAPVIRLKPNP